MVTLGSAALGSRWCTTSQPTLISQENRADTGRAHIRLRTADFVPGHRHQVQLHQGYSRDVARTMPHAYNTDATQKRLTEAAAPKSAGRWHSGDGDAEQSVLLPAGPYERACMIAHFLKSRKPKSKLVILDPKRAFSKQPVFVEAFDKHYKGIIELNLSNEIDDYSVVSVDPKTKEIVTKAGKRVRADVANIIPQQRAGEIAAKAGVNEGDGSDQS